MENSAEASIVNSVKRHTVGSVINSDRMVCASGFNRELGAFFSEKLPKCKVVQMASAGPILQELGAPFLCRVHR